MSAATPSPLERGWGEVDICIYTIVLWRGARRAGLFTIEKRFLKFDKRNLRKIRVLNPHYPCSN